MSEEHENMVRSHESGPTLTPEYLMWLAKLKRQEDSPALGCALLFAMVLIMLMSFCGGQ